MSFEPNADNFRQVFQEEAQEILVDLEASLLKLNEQSDDMDLVSCIFRALHTIKGSGAMFGFDELANFTHKLENAFDEVRNGRLKVSGELVDLSLRSLDQIKVYVEEKPVDEGISGDLLKQLQNLTSPESSTPVHSSCDPQERCAPEAANTEQIWKIHFAPGPAMLLNGSNPFVLLQEVRRLGQCQVAAHMDSLPSLADIDPECCYASWDLVLRTSATIDEIRDIFIFVEDACELKIEADQTTQSPAEETEADRTARGLQERRGEKGGRRSYDGPDNASSIRVPAGKLDEFVNLVGELVTVQARLSELAARRDDLEIAAVAEDVERLASALRANSMNVRMMPIRGTFEKFRRLVHDLARDLGKNVELTIDGADTELDKTVIDQLSDPLMHLIRNSMDHGIEPAEHRVAHGKPAMARVHLSARYSGANVLIEVADDGRGINADAVKARAIERGLVSADAALTESEIYSMIFEPGFSTAQQVTDISGRGVGMDVVRKNIEGLRGSIEVTSKAGLGTTVMLRLPLTLAIIDGLLVGVGETLFVVPLSNILECIEITRAEIDGAHGKQLVNVRGEIVPYIRLREQFHVATAAPEYEQILVLETDHGRYGVVVDQVMGNCQTMIKSLGRLYQHVQILSGATILGNGTVALILDPNRLVQESLRARRTNVRGHPDRALVAR